MKESFTNVDIKNPKIPAHMSPRMELYNYLNKILHNTKITEGMVGQCLYVEGYEEGIKSVESLINDLDKKRKELVCLSELLQVLVSEEPLYHKLKRENNS